MLETYSMSCFTCWSFLLFANSQQFLYYFLLIDACFDKGGEVANQIFAYKKDELSPSIVFFSHIVCLGLCCMAIVYKKTYTKLIMGSYKLHFLYTAICFILNYN
jgi:hypothetical protein